MTAIKRESNIELLRSIAMLMILLLHANFVALPYPTIEELELTPFIQISRYFLESLCIVSVSVFVYISGWFRIKTKIKSISNFLFQVFFFWGGGYVILLATGIADISITGLLHGLAIRHYDWFVKAYLFLFILAPILNTYIDNTSEKIQRYIISSFFITEFIYCWLGGARFFIGGYSPLMFIGYYLLAQYVRQYINDLTINNWLIKLFRFPKMIDLSLYILFAIINTILIATFSLKGYSINKILEYDNPLIIFGGFYLFLFFNKTPIKYNRIINWFGMSSFAVYLFHSQSDIRRFFINHIHTINDEYSGMLCALMILTYLILVYILSIIIDQIRIIIWKKISTLNLFKS